MGCFREKILTISVPLADFCPGDPNYFVPVDLAAYELTCHARRCLPELRPGMYSILYIAIIAAVVVSRRRKGALCKHRTGCPGTLSRMVRRWERRSISSSTARRDTHDDDDDDDYYSGCTCKWEH
jgi:hypothetical protein